MCSIYYYIELLDTILLASRKILHITHIMQLALHEKCPNTE